MNLVFNAFLLLVAAFILFLLYNFFKTKKVGEGIHLSPRRLHQILIQRVRFYKELKPAERISFRQRVADFLQKVSIVPAQGVKINTTDKIYVACAAIVPVFRYPDWEYRQLDTVVIRAGNFSKTFKGGPEEENVLGMVGDGAMHRMMVLSQHALRTGFEQKGRGNTAIHEFVHLIDKSDGAVDGLPEVLIPADLMSPWMDYMHRTIAEIRTGKETDINPYGATSEAEFLAVVSEYYFQRPEYMQEKHPELWALLHQIYERPTAAKES
jgi:Mlc titration factor MtfA (ptsG expression regulator)